MPLLLVWLLTRLRYDKRALFNWTILAMGLMVACYFFTPPAGPHPTDPNLPININYLYGTGATSKDKEMIVLHTSDSKRAAKLLG